MLKKVFLIFVLISVLMLSATCKRTGPFEPEIPDPIDGVFEIMYVRVKQVINVNAEDPTGGGATIYHPTYGYKGTSSWVFLGENKWQADIVLDYSRTEHTVFSIDRKVEAIYGEGIARDLYMRPRGSNNWTKLTCIKKNTHGVGGEQVEVIVDNTGIKNPSCGN